MSNEKKFKPGDIVRLKSGGPDITVEYNDEVENRRIVGCQWFLENKLQEGFFNEASLELVQKSDEE